MMGGETAVSSAQVAVIVVLEAGGSAVKSWYTIGPNFAFPIYVIACPCVIMEAVSIILYISAEVV